MPTSIGWNSTPVQPLGDQQKNDLSRAIDRVAKARSPLVDTAVSSKQGGVSRSVRDLSRAARDTVEGIAVTQVVEAGLTTVSGLLNQLMDTKESALTPDSLSQALDQIQGIFSGLQFNRRPLVSRPPFSRTFHLGMDPKETLSLTLPSMDLETLGTEGGASLADLKGKGPHATDRISILVEAQAEVARQVERMTRVRHQLEANVNQLVTTAMNLEAAGSDLTRLDLSREVSILKQIQSMETPPPHALLMDKGATSRLISLLD